jgi:hypothetical protein
MGKRFHPGYVCRQQGPEVVLPQTTAIFSLTGSRTTPRDVSGRWRRRMAKAVAHVLRYRVGRPELHRSSSANAKIELPDAIATTCLPPLR